MRKITSKTIVLAALCLAALAFTSCVSKEDVAALEKYDYEWAIGKGYSPKQAKQYVWERSITRHADREDESGFVTGGWDTVRLVQGAFNAPHIPNQAGANTQAATGAMATGAAAVGGAMSHCFVAGTPVRTPSGDREIQDIRAGDSALSFDERSGKVEPARVTKVITDRRSDLMVLSTAHGSVTCSQNHRFLTAESRWTMASALSASDKVLALAAGFTGVAPVKCAATHKDMRTPVTVHNFEVEGNHDYFVGPDAILCHNTK